MIGQLLDKLKDVDEVGSVLSPVGAVLKYPDGSLYILRATP